MKAVLMSIQPKWCELIANGKKTVEVRKTKPKLETPFKVYIYCTKGETIYLPRDIFGNNALNGKVIGEFVCNEIEEYHADDFLYGTYDIDDDEVIKTCLTGGLLWEYGKGGNLYAWHISDLVIYDKPKELFEFQKCPRKLPFDALTRPPQSWCYVEELGG